MSQHFLVSCHLSIIETQDVQFSKWGSNARIESSG